MPLLVSMEGLTLRQPELIGREEEFGKLKQNLKDAIEGKGSVVFISGEAGIGKTRIVSELIREAGASNARVLQGWCLAENMEPLLPIKAALRKGGLSQVISRNPPPLVVSIYLIHESGLLITEVQRHETGLDSDIFAGMLTAVGNFVKDSLTAMDKGGIGRLNTIGYGNYNIVLQSYGKITLGMVIEGQNSELLIEEMNNILKKIEPGLKSWVGNTSQAESAKKSISQFISSGKYDGKFLVDDPQIRQENLFDNILLGLQRSSSEQPLLLFLDDLQWADVTTLNLLHYLARNTKLNRILIMGTYRPEDIAQSDDGRPHPLVTAMQNMTREGLFQKIDLARLDQAHTDALINSMLGSSLMNKEVIDRIFEESGGTPLYTLEVVKLLMEYEHIRQTEDGWVLITDMKDLDIPSKVFDIIKRRLNRLSPDQKSILDCASIVGEEFVSGVVGKVMELNKLQLLEDLSKIEKIHQLVHYLGEKYRFDHSKTRDVLYESIGMELRQEYHRMIADVIIDMHSSTLDDIVSELAYHYNEAKDPRAAEFLIKAADAARAGYQNDEALDFYLSAFEGMGGAERWSILEIIGDIQVLTGNYEQAISSFEIILNEYQDPEMKIRMYRKMGETLEKKGDYDASLEQLEKAMELIGDDINIERGRIKVAEGYANYRVGNLDQALAFFLEGLGIFEELKGNFMDLATGLRAVGNLKFSKGEIDGALEYYGKSLEVSQRIDDNRGTATTLANMGVMTHIKGDLDGAFEYYNKALNIREKIGNKSGIADSLNNIGLFWSDRGEMKKALDCHERCLAIEEKIGNKSGIADSLNNIGTVHENMGDLDKTLEYHERSMKIREDIGDRTGIAMSFNNIGSVHKERDEPEKALKYYSKGLELCLDTGAKLPTFYAYGGLSEVYLILNNAEKAQESIMNAMDIAIEMGAMGEEGIANRFMGMLHSQKEDWPEAIVVFEKAETILEEVGNIEDGARVFYERGQMWKAKGDPQKASDDYNKSLKLYEEMGMKLWVGKCQAALGNLSNRR